MKPKKKITLRETKFAKTKLALLNAALTLLKQKPFADISVAELCRAAEVSPATFFNYFPKKTDLLVYFIQLWSVEMAHIARETAKAKGEIAAIESVFHATAAQCDAGAEVMGEILALMALRRPGQFTRPAPLTEAEKRQRFAHIDTFSGLADMGLESILPKHIKAAIAGGELPRSTDAAAAFEALGAIFLGVPVALAGHGPGNYQAAYRRQLHTLWKGLRGAGN